MPETALGAGSRWPCRPGKDPRAPRFGAFVIDCCSQRAAWWLAGLTAACSWRRLRAIAARTRPNLGDSGFFGVTNWGLLVCSFSVNCLHCRQRLIGHTLLRVVCWPTCWTGVVSIGR